MGDFAPRPLPGIRLWNPLGGFPPQTPLGYSPQMKIRGVATACT